MVENKNLKFDRLLLAYVIISIALVAIFVSLGIVVKNMKSSTIFSPETNIPHSVLAK
jgi:hypothetical protein